MADMPPDRTTPNQAQRCFTDGDSRIMPSGGGFIAGCNRQIAVDAAQQIIVARWLATKPADYAGLAPLMHQARSNLGRKPLMQAMADNIRRAGRRSRYRLRKQVVEPVFGQIKQARGEWAMLCAAQNMLKLHKAA